MDIEDPGTITGPGHIAGVTSFRLTWSNAKKTTAAPATWPATAIPKDGLDTAGLHVVETTYVDPGEPAPVIERDSVIKPTVSAGARDTGRFGLDQIDQATKLVAAIGASGRTAMVQPYLPSVDSEGEIAIVFIDGEPAHALRKRAVLRPGEIAPVRADPVGAAEAMYDPHLVRAATATEAELESATAVVAELARRFAGVPLYVRVDQLHDNQGVPVVLEVEAVEPNLYFDQAPDSAHRFADAIIARGASLS